MLRAGEDDDAPDAVLLQQVHQQGRLEVLGDGVDGLRDAARGRGGALHADPDGLTQQVAGELQDRRGHRRAEQQRLTVLRQLAQHAADVGQEAHVEHAVGLVEDEHLQLRQVRVGVLQVVEEAAGRRDDHVGALTEGALLRAHADAAEDARDAQAGVADEALRGLLDLRGELAGGREDQRARRAAPAAAETLQDRQEERGGLAAARRGGAEYVAAFEGGRDAGGLDGRGGLVAEVARGAGERGAQAQRVETDVGGGHGCLSREGRAWRGRRPTGRGVSLDAWTRGASRRINGGLRMCTTRKNRPARPLIGKI